MAKAAWKIIGVADSGGNTNRPGKGVVRCYPVDADGDENPDAAWYYPDPKSAAGNIRAHVAFRRGAEVSR